MMISDLLKNINLSSDVTGAIEIHRDGEECGDNESSNDSNGQSKRRGIRGNKEMMSSCLMSIVIKTMTSIML